MHFQTIALSHPDPFVAHVQLNRPKMRNALNHQMWTELPMAINALAVDPETRVIVISGSGKSFCSGIDLQDMQHQEIFSQEQDREMDVARRARKMGVTIRQYQKSLSSIDECPKPVIAAIHGHCLGGGIDLIAACDIRWASEETIFSIKEVDIGLCADVGTLNRLPKICGNNSWVRELAYTARNFGAQEALQNGLLSKMFASPEKCIDAALKLASNLAKKSPIAMQGTKINLNYSRDHSVKESLEYTALWNQSQLLTEDIPKSVVAAMTKSEPPIFAKL
ncbi:hypothetical protein QR680_001208 [Steinernema hermaphroditum]|uniref:Delta(3,5)-Delta(2,4)-dienoyl-CoA isomerase, mitochondrial n=1 Tax=Steinernema hermaphroditum TaxID=289476 RepID=A0AA39H045_9BILA|nr:hypothetical protein QR680_001208 [Steinernema hermaphroditum]